jgi:hypothetical protein
VISAAAPSKSRGEPTLATRVSSTVGEGRWTGYQRPSTGISTDFWGATTFRALRRTRSVSIDSNRPFSRPLVCGEAGAAGGALSRSRGQRACDLDGAGELRLKGLLHAKERRCDDPVDDRPQEVLWEVPDVGDH